MALFAGLGRLLLEADDRAPGSIIDRDFVDAHCSNFAEYEARTRQIDLDTVVEATGIDRTQLDRVATMLARIRTRTIACWAMGLTQHRHAVSMIAEIANVLLMRGMIGKPGAGLCPVRGHSNVQGDRSMGISEKMPETFLAALDDRFGIVSPREHGADTVDAVRAMRDGRAKVFIGMGGNFASAAPDTAVTEAGVAQLLVDGAGFDQAEPQPCRARRDRADPAVAGPHRQGHPGRRQTDGLRRGFDVDGASVAWQPQAAQRSGAQRGGDRVSARPDPAWPRSSGAVGEIQRRLRPDPGRHRRRRARLRRLQHQGPPARRLPVAAPSPRLARIPHQHR